MLRRTLFTLGLVAGCALHAASYAAVLLETKTPDDANLGRIWFEGSNLRVDFSGGGYLLIDTKANKRYMVNDAEKQVMEMPVASTQEFASMLADRGGKRELAKITIERQGKGPSIAGYDTEHYVVKADGKKCSDEYLAKDVLKNADVKQLMQTMQSLNEGEDASAIASLGPCVVQAEQALEKQYETLGLPLRSVDADGTITSEVVSIKTGVAAPKGAFTLPAGYTRVSMEDLIKQMQQEMPGTE